MLQHSTADYSFSYIMRWLQLAAEKWGPRQLIMMCPSNEHYNTETEL